VLSQCACWGPAGVFNRPLNGILIAFLNVRPADLDDAIIKYCIKPSFGTQPLNIQRIAIHPQRTDWKLKELVGLTHG
jgi:hypothetical protein